MSELSAETIINETALTENFAFPVEKPVTDGVHLSANRAATTVLFGYRYNHPAFWRYVEKLIAAIDVALPIKRRRRRSMREYSEISNALGNTLLTLFKSHLYFLGAPVGINLNRNFYTKKAVRYRKFSPGYDTVFTIFTGLMKLGFINLIKKGSYNRTDENKRRRSNSSTRITPSDKLIQQLWDLRVDLTDVRFDLSSETIFLRKRFVENGKRVVREVDYEETTQTKRMRNDVLIINNLLEKSHIDIQLTDKQFQDMQKALLNDKNANYQPIDLTRKHLKRIFNEDFRHGGRFYGAWWQQIGRQWRQHITINGKPTIELDYKFLHPTMIYKLAKQPVPSDPYIIGLSVQWRGYVKRMFNAIINANNKRIEKPDEYNPIEVGCSWSELRGKTEAFHQSIKKYFYSGYGLRLQRRDAEIANYILIKLAKEDVPCLPIHDSFIVQEKHKGSLYRYMEEAAVKFIRTEIPIKEEEGKYVELETERCKEYSRYMERLYKWRKAMA